MKTGCYKMTGDPYGCTDNTYKINDLQKSEGKIRPLKTLPNFELAPHLKKEPLTQKYLKSILNYNPQTGIFTYIKRTANNNYIGKVAGGTNNEGYRVICIKGKPYLEHRLAFLYMTGQWPKKIVDHIDMDKSNNVWENLRECNHTQNRINTFVRADNSSNHTGVNWHDKLQKWRVRIGYKGKRFALGCYDNKEEAVKAYKKKAKELYGEFARDHQHPELRKEK